MLLTPLRRLWAFMTRPTKVRIDPKRFPKGAKPSIDPFSFVAAFGASMGRGDFAARASVQAARELSGFYFSQPEATPEEQAIAYAVAEKLDPAFPWIPTASSKVEA